MTRADVDVTEKDRESLDRAKAYLGWYADGTCPNHDADPCRLGCETRARELAVILKQERAEGIAQERERSKALEAAVQPFVIAADAIDLTVRRLSDDVGLWERTSNVPGMPTCRITLGDVRRVRDLLRPPEGDEHG